MVTMEMPQVNILSKIDLFDEEASFNLDYFTHLPDVNRLLELLNVSIRALLITLCGTHLKDSDLRRRCLDWSVIADLMPQFAMSSPASTSSALCH